MKFLLDENLPAYYRTVFCIDNEHEGYHVKQKRQQNWYLPLGPPARLQTRCVF
jgi:hypothetical protein